MIVALPFKVNGRGKIDGERQVFFVNHPYLESYFSHFWIALALE